MFGHFKYQSLIQGNQGTKETPEQDFWPKWDPNFVELDQSDKRITSHDAAEPLRRHKRANVVVEDAIEEKSKVPYHKDIDFASTSIKGQLPLPKSNSNSDQPQTPPGFWDPEIVELEDDDPRNIILPAPILKKASSSCQKGC